MRLPDPPLTTFGISQAANINLPAAPDLIVISPMRRTIQTAIHAFNLHADKMPFTPAVQIWPDLLGAGRRMFHLWATIDAGGGMENDTTACATITTSDMGSTMTTPADAAAIAATPRAVVRAELEAGYPQFDFSLCDDEWEYPRYTPVETEARAARVRKRLATMAEECGYQNIYVVTHGGFAKDLAQSDTKPRNGGTYSVSVSSLDCLLAHRNVWLILTVFRSSYRVPSI
ncbi:hypothetical protein B0T17DRAFT_253559 [Bombardia bombarda]|uniref:Phosphoglycerate mutase n=1 Tax=Bombardia bombarda TaxID=252184 RepID=A0AA39X0V4_9PEZI|nr:hypothetical protein B0T17DRAFT_253559 [Bombardia bombarda]